MLGFRILYAVPAKVVTLSDPSNAADTNARNVQFQRSSGRKRRQGYVSSSARESLFRLAFPSSRHGATARDRIPRLGGTR